MPYRRKRRGYRKRRYKKKDTVKKVRRAVNKIKRQIETKHFTIVHGNQNLVQVPTLYLVQPLITDRGTSSSSVIGSKYHVNGIKCTGVLKKTNDASSQVSSVRFVGLWVKGAAMKTSLTFNDLFEDIDDEGGATIIPYLAPLRSQQNKNVKVLFDKKWDFGARDNATGMGGGRQANHFSFYKRINQPVIFDEENDQISRGRMYVYAMGFYGNQCALTWLSKLYYTDA